MARGNIPRFVELPEPITDRVILRLAKALWRAECDWSYGVNYSQKQDWDDLSERAQIEFYHKVEILLDEYYSTVADFNLKMA